MRPRTSWPPFSLLAALAIFGSACRPSGGPAEPSRARPAPANPAIGSEHGSIAYEIHAMQGGSSLFVEAAFSFAPGTDFVVDDGLDPFVEDLAVSDGATADAALVPIWQGAPAPAGGTFHLAPCGRGPCRVRYRFALERAGGEMDQLDVAAARDGAYLAPPSTWLLRPSMLAPGSSVRMHLDLPEGTAFVTGLFRGRGAANTFVTDAANLAEAPYSAFGSLRVTRLAIGAGDIEIAFVPGTFALPDAALVSWVQTAARNVETYFGRFPVPHVLVLLVPTEGRRIGYATTLGNGGASILAPIGKEIDQRALSNDWVMTHEMVHLGFPALAQRYAWLEEGIATYVEPIARARRGLLSPEQVWEGLLEGLPKGLPGPHDRGLDLTHTWGRTYWGGALYCIVADVRIRQRTGNRKSFDDALRAILANGGNVSTTWPLTRVLDEADRATGVPVLRELYMEMGLRPSSLDLSELFRQLGVASRGDEVIFDDRAPLAELRRAITMTTEHAR